MKRIHRDPKSCQSLISKREKVSAGTIQGEKRVLEEDNDEETEVDEYSNPPIIKAVSEAAPVKLLTQAFSGSGQDETDPTASNGGTGKHANDQAQSKKVLLLWSSRHFRAQCHRNKTEPDLTAEVLKVLQKLVFAQKV